MAEPEPLPAQLFVDPPTDRYARVEQGLGMDPLLYLYVGERLNLWWWPVGVVPFESPMLRGDERLSLACQCLTEDSDVFVSPRTVRRWHARYYLALSPEERFTVNRMVEVAAYGLGDAGHRRAIDHLASLFSPFGLGVPVSPARLPL